MGSPLEEDLCNWGHHASSSSVPDVIFQDSAGDEVNLFESSLATVYRLTIGGIFRPNQNAV